MDGSWSAPSDISPIIDLAKNEPYPSISLLGRSRNLRVRDRMGPCHPACPAQALFEAAAAIAVARRITGNASTDVQLNYAALFQHAFELTATALYPGFHPGDRNPKLFRSCGVCQALKLYEFQRLPILNRQTTDERLQASGYLSTRCLGVISRAAE